MFSSLIAFLLASFVSTGAPPQEVQDEVAFQNCASSYDPAACQAQLDR